MQKFIITLATFFVAMQLGAATYTILSQNNDTIRLYSNELGESLKSLIPWKNAMDMLERKVSTYIESFYKANKVALLLTGAVFLFMLDVIWQSISIFLLKIVDFVFYK